MNNFNFTPTPSADMTDKTSNWFSKNCFHIFLGITAFFVSYSALADEHTVAADTLYRRNPGVVTPKGPYMPERAMKNNILYTRLDVRFDWQRQQVPATAIIKFSPHFYPQNTLELDAKGFEIRDISLLDTLSDYGPVSSAEVNKRVIKSLISSIINGN